MVFVVCILVMDFLLKRCFWIALAFRRFDEAMIAEVRDGVVHGTRGCREKKVKNEGEGAN